MEQGRATQDTDSGQSPRMKHLWAVIKIRLLTLDLRAAESALNDVLAKNARDDEQIGHIRKEVDALRHNLAVLRSEARKLVRDMASTGKPSFQLGYGD